jgi:SAM-dependent methyltransferase
MSSKPPAYLDPYVRAVRRHGAGFNALLWASPHTQRLRFEAIVRLVDPSKLNVLDCGCGRADFLDFLVARNLAPVHYVGIEAMPEFAQAALGKNHPRRQIVQADYVREPARLLVGADLVVFCGSLNTLDDSQFYGVLHAAWAATGTAMAFNFLCSEKLASADWLAWRRTHDVLQWAKRLSENVAMLDDYYEGDCTIAMRK